MTKYILVEWPNTQYFMEHPRYSECYHCDGVDFNNRETCGALMVPEDLYEEIELNKLYPAEFDIPIGHIKITMNEVELNGIKYTREESQLQKGSEVILYNPEKGYWITKCLCWQYGFPMIFEDNSTLIDSEIIGIRNEEKSI